MRVGIDARLIYYRPGGIAEYTRHLIGELATLDQVTDFRVIHHRRAQEALTPGPNFRRINAYTPCHHRLERWSLSIELLQHRFDILHSPDSIPPKRGARRQVITVHDLHFLHFPQFMTAESLRYYQDRIAWAVQTADHILASSNATRDDLCNLLDVRPEQMTVHMLGVDRTFCVLPENIVAEHRARLGLPESYILFVGTFEPRKNISGLLDAYHVLRQEVPDAPSLVLVGRRGWLYDEMFAKVDVLKLTNHLIWLEDVATADLPAIYNGAAVVALPSHYEGFGLTALEAMACGTPPVVTNRSSLPEVVGNAGLLVDPHDPTDIANAIMRILFDSKLRDQLRATGLARAATFTWRKTAETALQVYRTLSS